MSALDEDSRERLAEQSWDGLVVIASGMSWDDTRLSEKQLALHLARNHPVLFVDPPISILSPLRKPQVAASLRQPRLRTVAHNIARLTPRALPGIGRPGLRHLALLSSRRAIASAVERLGGRVRALIVASLDDLFDSCEADLKILYGTDDFAAGGELLGIAPTWLRHRESDQLARADLVVAVSDSLAQRWSSRAGRLVVIENGCDANFLATADTVPPAPDVRLPAPIAGFVGHLSERIDLSLLEAVASTGDSLLLVGGRQNTFEIERMASLLSCANVQWVGAKDFAELPSYLRHMSVGLTPYADTDFNRSSFPLKTLEYLAAGRSVVATDLPSAQSLPADLVHRRSGSEAFAACVSAELARPHDEGLVERRKQCARERSWANVADRFTSVLDEG